MNPVIGKDIFDVPVIATINFHKAIVTFESKGSKVDAPLLDVAKSGEIWNTVTINDQTMGYNIYLDEEKKVFVLVSGLILNEDGKCSYDTQSMKGIEHSEIGTIDATPKWKGYINPNLSKNG